MQDWIVSILTSKWFAPFMLALIVATFWIGLSAIKRGYLFSPSKN
jgi:hypothetical protein